MRSLSGGIERVDSKWQQNLCPVAAQEAFTGRKGDQTAKLYLKVYSYNITCTLALPT